MKKQLLIIQFLLITFLSYSQNIPVLHWAKSTGGVNNDLGRSITKDASGNVYTTGGFLDIVDFDPGPGTFILNSNTGNAFISKLDASGNFVWAKNFGGGMFGMGISVDVDVLGNVYIAGDFSATQDFDPGPGTFTLTGMGVNDAFILKLNSSGNFIWANQIGGINYDGAREVHIDSNGDVYTIGNFNGTVDFDPGVGTYTLSSAASNCFVLKLTSAGNFIWAKMIASANGNGGYSINSDALSNVYFTGFYGGTADFDTGPGTFTYTEMGNGDAFVVKLDVAGNFIWAQSMGSIGNDAGNSISLDANGDVFCSGSFNNTIDLDPGPGTFTFASLGLADAFVLKLNQLGNFVWAKRIGGTDVDMIMAGDVDGGGSVYSTGHFRGTVDFDPGPSTFNLTSAGLEDIFICKLDPSGNFVYAGIMGGTSADFGYGIKAALGDIHTTGLFAATGDFDPGAGTNTLTSLGNDDVFIHKMRQCAALTSSLNIQNVTSCNGYSNGSATVSPTGNGPFVYAWLPFGGNSVTATNLGSGNYSCNITNSCAVQITQTLFLSQPPLLFVNIIPSNGSICVGSSTILTANAGGGTGLISYTWVSGPNSSVTVVSPTVPTTYTIDISDANNCTKSQTVNIGIFQLPNILYGANHTTICIGQSVTYTATGAINYSWQPGNLTGSVVVFSPTITTDFTVTGTDANGCTNSLVINQVVDPCIGIFENNLNSNSILKVYPNPNNGIFEIDLKSDAQVIITNPLGQIILDEIKVIGKNILNIENNVAGIYFLSVINDNRKQVLKIMKE